jgi:hypothetical protein
MSALRSLGRVALLDAAAEAEDAESGLRRNEAGLRQQDRARPRGVRVQPSPKMLQEVQQLVGRGTAWGECGYARASAMACSRGMACPSAHAAAKASSPSRARTVAIVRSRSPRAAGGGWAPIA